MTEALEWFQCKECGRRQRWTAEWAGKRLTCSCGAKVICPTGPQNDTAGAGDTLIESADAPSTTSTWAQIIDREVRSSPKAATSLARPGSVTSAAARAASKLFLIWTIVLLVGVAMLIHVAILWPTRHTFWPFWIYAGVAVLTAPLALFKYGSAKRRWQRGRSFMEAFAQSLGADAEE